MASKSFLEQPTLHARAEHRAALLTYPGNAAEAFRQAVADPSKTLFGAAHGIPSVFVTKILASAQPDFIWMDAEHGPWGRLDLYNAIHAAQHHSEGRSLVMVRVPRHDSTLLVTALDAGASAIVIPHTESAEDIKEFVQAMYYPPIGKRSFCPWTSTPGVSDASLYEDDPFNFETGNRHIIIIPQIETAKGIENLEEIASTPGVSGLMLGPVDLCLDSGIRFRLGQPLPEQLSAAMAKMEAMGKKYKVPLFGAALDPTHIGPLIKQGFAGIAVCWDLWNLASLTSAALKGARATALQVGEEVAAEKIAAEKKAAEPAADNKADGETVKLPTRA